MPVDREKLRRETGVRELADIDGTVTFRMSFHPPAWVVASLHPAVVVADSLAVADKRAAELAAKGRPALAAEMRCGKGKDAFARCVENVIRAARMLCHFTGGRTMDMWAEGASAEAAKTAYLIERAYFDGFNGDGAMK